MHRLNRTEYQNEIRRLLDLDIDAAALLPKDTKADGFDNVALALRVSPAFLDAYIVAAQEVSAKALGGNAARATSTVYRVSPGTARYQHQEGLPLGTRGGMLVEHLFPANGEYTFNITQSGNRGGGYITGLDSRQRLVMTAGWSPRYSSSSLAAKKTSRRWTSARPRPTRKCRIASATST